MHRVELFLVSVIPTFTLVVGVALTGATMSSGFVIDPSLRLAMGIAAFAPLLAAIALRSFVPGGDLVIVACAGMLMAIGVTTLSALARSEGVAGAFYSTIATRHGLFAGAGFLAMTAGAMVAPRIDRVALYPFTLLGGALVLTVLTVFFGETVNGARLWLQIGPVRFQPSEVARLLVAMFVAVFLYDRRHLVASPWRVGLVDLPPAPYLLPLAAAVLGAAGVLVLQNDLGMAALVVLGAAATVVAILRSRLGIIAAAVLLGVALTGAYFAVERVRSRVSGWFDPWHEPGDRGFQFVRADYGLAGGGLAGGNGEATAAVLPEVHTDFILAGVGSQLGLLTSLAVLALFGLLVSRCVLAVLRASDGFRGLLTLSISALLGIQVILIVAGTVRVLPLTGLTLPLVSYGGTSMVVTLFALGLIVGMGADTTHSH